MIGELLLKFDMRVTHDLIGRAMDFFVDDGALFHTIKPGGVEEWTPQYRQMRGAFRYMTLFLNSTGTVTITDVRCFNNMMPHWEDLRNYGG